MVGLKTIAGVGIAAGMALTCSVAASAGPIVVPDTGVFVADGFGFDMTVATSGNGFGAVDNLLTMQEPRSGFEDGQVVWSGAFDTYHSLLSTVSENSNKTATHSLGDLGIDSGDELLIVWNPSERGADPANSVTDAYLIFYNVGGAELLALELDGNPQDHDTVNNGLGGNGFAYLLTASGLLAFDQMITDAGAGWGRHSDRYVGGSWQITWLSGRQRPRHLDRQIYARRRWPNLS